MLGAIVLTVPAVAASSNQFDLVCKGKEQKRTGVPATAWTERSRIDLNAKRWCRGACKAPAQISSITADEILIFDSRAAIGGHPDTELKLSLTRGTVSEAAMMGWSGSGASLADGTCRREYLSGFLPRRF